MQRLIGLILVASSLYLLTLGVGGCGGNGLVSIPVGSFSNFNGTYQLRDQNCTDPVPKKFGIDDPAGILVIMDPGNSGLSQGDIFSLSEIDSDTGTPEIQAPALGCTGFLVPSEESAMNTEEIVLVNVESGDLVVFCPDSSVDGQCTASFARISSSL